jgi:high-affinity iron transporter
VSEHKNRAEHHDQEVTVLPTFVIGLREGLEASLIVGIIAAFLIQREQRRGLRWMWIGVAAALGLCAAIAVALRVVGESLPLRERETLEGALALLAVAGVTYMIVWMRRHSRDLKGSLESSAWRAVGTGSALGLVAMAFVAVVREGLETAVFLLAAFANSAEPVAAGIGAITGLIVAVALGYAIYRGGLRINLSRFFRVTGVVLAIVAAGLLASAAHEFAEAGVVSALQRPAFDLSWLVAPGTIRASLATGMLGLQPVPTVLEVAVWALYAVPIVLYVAWPARTPRRPVSRAVEMPAG